MELVSTEFGLAKRDEAPVLARMSRDYVEQGLNWRWRTPAILNMIRDPEAVVLCARCQRSGNNGAGLPSRPAAGRHGTADGRWHGTVIGGFGIMQYAMERAHLNLLAVHPSLRRHGLASDLLAWLEKTAAVAGIARVDLEVRARNTGGRAFYRARGYDEADFVPRYYSGVEAAIRMHKRLR